MKKITVLLLMLGMLAAQSRHMPADTSVVSKHKITIKTINNLNTLQRIHYITTSSYNNYSFASD